MLNRMQAEKEELDLLRRRGFTDRQIARLCQLRTIYGQNELDMRHLAFARYLVTTGRLSEGERETATETKQGTTHSGLLTHVLLSCVQPWPMFFSAACSLGSKRFWPYSGAYAGARKSS
jgi:hypothetical protein